MVEALKATAVCLGGFCIALIDLKVFEMTHGRAAAVDVAGWMTLVATAIGIVVFARSQGVSSQTEYSAVTPTSGTTN